MKLLVMLSVLFLRNLHSQKLTLPLDKLFKKWQFFWAKRLNTTAGTVPVFLVSVLGCLIPLGLLLWAVEGLYWNLITLAIHLSVVIYTLGRRCEAVWILKYIQAQKQGDSAAAQHYATEILGDEFIDSNKQELHWRLMCRLVVFAFDRLFLVLFWYLLLGPIGSLLARLTEEFIKNAQDTTQIQILRLQTMLQWPAARLMGLTLGLTAHPWLGLVQFFQDLKNWRLTPERILNRQLRLGPCPQPEALTDAAEQELIQLQERVERSLGVWIALTALGIIFLY